MWNTITDKKPTISELEYTTDKIKLLGVWIGNQDLSNDNWTLVIDNVTRLLGM